MLTSATPFPFAGSYALLRGECHRAGLPAGKDVQRRVRVQQVLPDGRRLVTAPEERIRLAPYRWATLPAIQRTVPRAALLREGRAAKVRSK